MRSGIQSGKLGMMDGRGIGPLTSTAPDAASGSTRRPALSREGSHRSRRPFPLTQTKRKSHGGGRASRAKMHVAPRHRFPVVNIATSRLVGIGRTAATVRPSSFLAENSGQNLLCLRDSRVVQSVSFPLALAGIRDERGVLRDGATKGNNILD